MKQHLLKRGSLTLWILQDVSDCCTIITSIRAIKDKTNWEEGVPLIPIFMGIRKLKGI
jgi:hypothetical protein